MEVKINVNKDLVSRIRLDSVNELLKYSFGRGFKGDYVQGDTLADMRENLWRTGRLGLIAKATQHIPFFRQRYIIAGRFNNQDGSDITVYSQEFLKKHVELYIGLYEALFNKEVKVGLEQSRAL